MNTDTKSAPPTPKKKKAKARKPAGRKRIRNTTTERYRSFWLDDETLADYMDIAAAINRTRVRAHQKGRISLNSLYVEALQDWAKRAKKKLKLTDE